MVTIISPGGCETGGSRVRSRTGIPRVKATASSLPVGIAYLLHLLLVGHRHRLEGMGLC